MKEVRRQKERRKKREKNSRRETFASDTFFTSPCIAPSPVFSLVQKTKPEPPSKSEQFLLHSVVLTKPEEDSFTAEMVCAISSPLLAPEAIVNLNACVWMTDLRLFSIM